MKLTLQRSLTDPKFVKLYKSLYFPQRGLNNVACMIIENSNLNKKVLQLAFWNKLLKMEFKNPYTYYWCSLAFVQFNVLAIGQLVWSSIASKVKIGWISKVNFKSESSLIGRNVYTMTSINVTIRSGKIKWSPTCLEPLTNCSLKEILKMSIGWGWQLKYVRSRIQISNGGRCSSFRSVNVKVLKFLFKSFF